MRCTPCLPRKKVGQGVFYFHRCENKEKGESLVKIKRDQITGLALVVLGIVFGVMTNNFKKPFTPEYPGPKLMPFIAVFGLVVCGLGVFINGCRQKGEDKPFLGKVGWTRVLVSFVGLCVYVAGLKYLGFLISTPIALYGITTYFAGSSKIETKLWVRIVFAVVVSLVIWAMYVLLFNMSLPVGMLFE